MAMATKATKKSRTATAASSALTAARLEDILDAYGQALADHVARAFPPQYDLHTPSPDDARILASLGRPCYPAQAHAARALATRLRSHRSALCVGEPSCGKTQIALATAALLRARRILIVAPSSLLTQWHREIRAVLPQAVIHTGLNTPSGVDRAARAMRDGRTHVVLLARDHAKLDSPWAPAAVELPHNGPLPTTLPYCPACRRIPHAVLAPLGPASLQGARAVLERLGLPADHHAPDALVLVPTHRLPPKAAGVACSACETRTVPAAVTLPQNDPEPALLACPRCRAPLATVRTATSNGQVTAAATLLTPHALRTARRSCPFCGEALWQATRTLHGRATTSIARYMARRHKGLFDLLIADEIHTYKARETAQGLMLAELGHAARRILGLTATLMGGSPGTVFHLLHRVSPEFRAEWPHSAATSFSRRYGLGEITVRFARDDAPGAHAGRITRALAPRRDTREIPGVSPAILRYVLPLAAFLSLRDLGVALPPYEETVSLIPMTGELEAEYAKLAALLAPHLLEGIRQRRLRALGTALQALLTYPDQPWKGETVISPATGQVVATAPALDPSALYPKEQELLRICREEARQGRRALVYVTHTDRRDITPRLLALLRDAGLRAEALRAGTVSPARRADWIREHAPGLDALIVHPRLVGTGLNILDFHTIVWHEPELSAYTLRQASRRTWRIGQTQPVRVHYLAYQGTAQEAALGLVSRKILASLLIEGQVETDHALALQDAQEDVFYALARAVLDRARIEDVHETLARISRAEAAAMGQGAAPAAAHRPSPLPGRRAPARRRAAIPTALTGPLPAQVSLFDI
jgi:hypothetical protein